MSGEHPDFLWRSPEPKRAYEVVIVGGGGHGLATAYYLAKEHGITDVAVLERGWLAGGNITRNTTIIRSNYLWDESAAIYEHALKLWEGLEAELDYDLLFSQRGVLNLAHTLQDVRDGVRRVAGERAERHRRRVARAGGGRRGLPDPERLARRALPGARRDLPAARRDRPPRERRLGVRARGRRARASTSSRAARCSGSRSRTGGRSASRPRSAASPPPGSRSSPPGHSSVLAGMAGLRLPIQTHPLQALVSELYEQVLDTS